LAQFCKIDTGAYRDGDPPDVGGTRVRRARSQAYYASPRGRLGVVRARTLQIVHFAWPYQRRTPPRMPPMMPAALSCDCKSWRGLLPFGRPCRLRGQATFHRAADSFRAARNSVRRLPRRRPVLLDASQLSLDPGSRSILPTMPNQAIRAEADGGAARRSALVGRTTCSRIPLLRRGFSRRVTSFVSCV
jgi:hypothetical protein